MGIKSTFGLHPVGSIVAFSGSAAPSGWLQCPTAATNISRVQFAALFAAIGTAWGAGDGANTFGMPFFPNGYAQVHGTVGIGAQSAGQVVSHTHNLLALGYNGLIVGGASPLLSNPAGGTSSGAVQSTGGAANLAAGSTVMMCVKY